MQTDYENSAGRSSLKQNITSTHSSRHTPIQNPWRSALKWGLMALVLAGVWHPSQASGEDQDPPTEVQNQQTTPEAPAFRTELLQSGCTDPLLLGFAGDIYISSRSFRLGTQLTKGVDPILAMSDLFVANFEGVVGTNLQRAFPDAPFALKMPSDVPVFLKASGVTAVTLGNNHIMDFGTPGLESTLKALNAAGLPFAGVGMNEKQASAPLVLHAKGHTVHILSFNATLPKESWSNETKPGTAYPSKSVLESAIAKSRAAADFIAVSFHWGQESTIELRPYQRQMATRALQSGADFVYGHHAHIAQVIERSGDRTIAYGMGNFLFDSYSKNSIMSLAALIPLCIGHGVHKDRAQPVFIPLLTNNFKNHFITRPMEEHEFLKAAQPYAQADAIDPATLLWFPDGHQPRPFSSLSTKIPRLPAPDLQKMDNSASLPTEEQPAKEKIHEKAEPDEAR
jgi:hypothetical protein